MNIDKKKIESAYKRLVIVFAANIVLLSGMMFESMLAIATGNEVFLLMMLCLVAFGWIVIPVLVVMIWTIVSFINGLCKLKQGDWKKAIKNGMWCSILGMIPVVLYSIVVLWDVYRNFTWSFIIECVCIGIIIFDITVIYTFIRLSRCMRVAKIENSIKENVWEENVVETKTYEMEVPDEVTTYEKVTNTKIYKDQMNVEDGLDQKVYKKLGMIVWGSVVLIAIVMLACLVYEMYTELQWSVVNVIAYLFAYVFIIGVFIGSAVFCMILFYRKGLQYIKDGNLQEARVRGVCICAMSLYVYTFLFFFAEIVLELQGAALYLLFCCYVAVLVYQIYVISLFVKLRRSKKATVMKETAIGIHNVRKECE